MAIVGLAFLRRAALAVALGATTVSFAPLVLGPSAAQAQERSRTLFEMLFTPRKQRPVEGLNFPPPPPKSTKRSAPRTTPAAPPEPPAIEKLVDAKVVLVVGDFLANGLAEGLSEAYSQNQAIRVVSRTNGASGIVRNDHFDWPSQIGEMIEAEKPTAVVVMLGSNDRQEMRVGDTREPKRSEAWTKEYERRVATLAKVVRDRGLPLVWVGMTPFKLSSMSSDMLAYNDIYESAAEKAGGVFVDIWDGFVDENGAFAASGPDINGNPARLRTGDNGVSLTKAGKRKVAFYVEKPLEKILGLDKGPLVGSLGTPDTLPGATPAPLTPADIERTNPIALTDPELDGGTELMGARVDTAKGAARTPSEKMAIEGVAPRAVAGRADDFGIGQEPRAAAAAPAPATPAEAATPAPVETTSAISR